MKIWWILQKSKLCWHGHLTVIMKNFWTQRIYLSVTSFKLQAISPRYTVRKYKNKKKHTHKTLATVVAVVQGYFEFWQNKKIKYHKYQWNDSHCLIIQLNRLRTGSQACRIWWKKPGGFVHFYWIKTAEGENSTAFHMSTSFEFKNTQLLNFYCIL